MTIRKLVDGGYISWVFGASSYGLRSWNRGSWKKFRKSEGVVILMDSPESLRRGYYPEYKAHRAERYEDDAQKLEAKERVTTLRNDLILEDPRLWTITIPGLEADDLIACMAYLRVLQLETPVIGIDKDLFQIPKTLLTFQDHHGNVVDMKKFISKLPGAVQGKINHQSLIPLVLSLYGDKSDNIKKVIGNVRELVPVLMHRTPYQKAYQLYGDEFIHNLWLTLLPYPGLVYPIPDPLDLPRHMDEHSSNGWVGGKFKVNSEIANIIDEYILGTRVDGGDF